EAKAKDYQVVLSENTLPDKFRELIEKLHVSTGQQVVVLIDEYDKPITDNLLTPDIAEDNRKILHSFYQILKAADEHLRFVFFTGVSKFAGLSIFSGLNNLKDITLNPNFASICGYTQQELESNFPEHIAATAEAQKMSVEKLLAEIKFWYNGYSWDSETSVYNPFSTLLFFDLKDFDNFWFQSGTPTFLVEIIKKRNDIQPILEPVAINYIQWSFHEPETMELAPLLMQTGYLTIKEKRGSGINREYILDFPNFEVRQSFLAWVLNAYSNCPISSSRLFVNRLTQSILSGNTAELEKGLREMLAGIPYKLHLPREAYYHSLFLVWVRLLGFEIQGEYLTDIGRIDAVWRIGERVVIAEIKCQPKKKDTAKLLKEAFAQIKEKRYADTFGAGKQVTYLAIAFADKQVAAKIENA
ncbi:MAG: ATP-binding protein, partial [Puniceicoccales bacterium]|nr:ATP-binding protein [Puniceicoccales bacterium]